jgi:hypothetical protein
MPFFPYSSVSTQQIYTVVLEIKSSVSSVDTRWTYFQAPITVEDAFGFKFPVPSEYDFSMLEHIIKYQFREGEASEDVKAGNYELFKSKNSSEVLPAGARLFPGIKITMAIIVAMSSPIVEVCPMPLCKSVEMIPALGGARIWQVKHLGTDGMETSTNG